MAMWPTLLRPQDDVKKSILAFFLHKNLIDAPSKFKDDAYLYFSDQSDKVIE